MKKWIYIFLASLFAFPVLAGAVQISVPSAPSKGYFLVSTTTGNYIATTTDPVHGGFFFATSTATSTLPNTSGTGLAYAYLCLTADTCRSTWPTSGSGGTGNVATSTTEQKGQLAYWTSTGATPATLGIVATTSLSVSAPITFSGTLGAQIEGVAGSFGCTNSSAGVTGCLTGTDWTTFNSKLSAYDAWSHSANFNQTMSATSTPLWASKTTGVSLAASSTSWFDQVNVGSTTASTMATSTFYGSVSIAGTASSTQLLLSSAVGTAGCATFSALGQLSNTGTACGTGGGGSDPFSHLSNFNQTMSATSTGLWASKTTGVSFAASSTAWFDQINVGSTTASQMATSTFYGNTSIAGNASTTNLVISGLGGASGCLSVNAAGVVGTSACSGSSGTDPFSHSANFNTTMSATTTPLWFQGTIALAASSTAYFEDISLNKTINFASTSVATDTLAYLTSSRGFLTASTTGGNVGLGTDALTRVTSGTRLTALGFQAGLNATSSTQSVYIGYQAGKGGAAHQNNTGNTFIGYLTGSAITSGTGNTCIGWQGCLSLTTGLENIALSGPAFGGTMDACTSCSYNIVMGRAAGANMTTGQVNILLGNLAGAGVTTADSQIMIGSGVGAGTLPSGIGQNIGIGNNAFASAVMTAGGNIAIGDAMPVVTDGTSNISLGFGTPLQSLTTGGYNFNAGGFGMKKLTTGSFNFCLGYFCLGENTTGSNNFSAGVNSSLYNMSATNTVAIGGQAASGAAVGVPFNNQGGVVIGFQAGSSFGTGSDWSTLIGHQSGYGLTTGGSNILIGAATSTNTIDTITTGSMNIKIGTNTSFPSATANGQLSIGNQIYGTGMNGTGSTVSTGRIGIATTTPWRTFSVTGTMANTGMTGATAGTNSDVCISATGDFINESTGTCIVSSKRFKHDIRPMDFSVLTIVKSLTPASFRRNETPDVERWGFIAEEAASADPHLATYGVDGLPRGLDEHALIGVLWKALQEQQGQIDSLTKRLQALER